MNELYGLYFAVFRCCMREIVGENWYSCPSELVSPRREYQKLVLVLFELLA